MVTQIDNKSILGQPELLSKFMDAISSDAEFLRGSYPNFDRWIVQKVIPGIFDGNRTVMLEERSGAIVGLLILKHTSDERKICTLRVKPEYENRGLGVKLFEKSFEILEVETPLLSVSEVSLPKFERIFKHFGFIFERSYLGMYLPKVHEFAFNGILVTGEVEEVKSKSGLEKKNS